MTGNTMLAGWASEEITPELPCWLGGYAARGAPAHAIHDALYARALALASVKEPCLIMLCDLLAISDELLQEARRRIKALLPGATVWLGATHTHSGPAIGDSRLLPGEQAVQGRQRDIDVHMAEQSSRIMERVVSALVQAAQDAVARMHLVECAWASAQTRGVVTNRDHPGSGEDTCLDLLCLYEPSHGPARTAARRFRPPAVILGSFPCHPTVLGAENLEISADLPGAFRRQLRALCGTTTWVMLATGAAGDMSTRHTRRGQGFSELERLGALLARQAFAMLSSARPVQLAPPLVRGTVVELDVKAAADIEALEEQAIAVQAEMRAALAAGKTAQARTLETALQGIQAAQRAATSHSSVPRQVELSTIIMGELALVAIPGELYNRLGVEIRQSTVGPLLLFGYTNGYSGYLPTHDAYAHLDYEVLMSPFAPGSGERVRDAAIHLLKQSPETEEGDRLQ